MLGNNRHKLSARMPSYYGITVVLLCVSSVTLAVNGLLFLGLQVAQFDPNLSHIIPNVGKVSSIRT